MCTSRQPTKPQCDSNLQVVKLQRAVAAQKLETEKQAAALVQAQIDEKVAEELKKVAPGYLHAPKKTKKTGTATCRLLGLAHRKGRGRELSMLSEPTPYLQRSVRDPQWRCSWIPWGPWVFKT